MRQFSNGERVLILDKKGSYKEAWIRDRVRDPYTGDHYKVAVDYYVFYHIRWVSESSIQGLIKEGV